MLSGVEGFTLTGLRAEGFGRRVEGVEGLVRV